MPLGIFCVLEEEYCSNVYEFLASLSTRVSKSNPTNKDNPKLYPVNLLKVYEKCRTLQREGFTFIG